MYIYTICIYIYTIYIYIYNINIYTYMYIYIQYIYIYAYICIHAYTHEPEYLIYIYETHLAQPRYGGRAFGCEDGVAAPQREPLYGAIAKESENSRLLQNTRRLPIRPANLLTFTMTRQGERGTRATVISNSPSAKLSLSW